MGVVYKALDTRLRRHVALKFLPAELTRNAPAKQRFLLEAHAASTLDHPNVCTVHEVDETPDGRLFIAMAYYQGQSLRQRIEQGPLGVPEALKIALQVARGLEAAHRAGIVHRDIKPANIMLPPGGEVKVLDFGLAKLEGEARRLTRTGTTMGTRGLHVPRAGERRHGRRAQRPLVAGRGALRDAHRPAAVQGRARPQPDLLHPPRPRPRRCAPTSPARRAPSSGCSSGCSRRTPATATSPRPRSSRRSRPWPAARTWRPPSWRSPARSGARCAGAGGRCAGRRRPPSPCSPWRPRAGSGSAPRAAAAPRPRRGRSCATWRSCRSPT